VVDEVDDAPRVSHVDVTIHLPPEAIAEGLEARVKAGIGKYSYARLRAVEQEARENRSRGWLMMVFAIFAVFALVWVAQKFSYSGHGLLGVASEGLSIAARLMLWHPLDELVFNRWDRRLNRRALLTLRDRSSLHIMPLESEPDVAA
jgi:hypothetical protein